MIDLATVQSQIPLWFAAASSGREEEPNSEGYDLRPNVATKKVLIVEDEFFIALDAQAQVEALGHTVVGIAVSAEQAIMIAERERPDFALMDIRLSGDRDGIDAAIEIRNRYGVESIFVTANTDPVTLQRAQSIKPIAVLHKPLTEAELSRQIAQIKWK